MDKRQDIFLKEKPVMALVTIRMNREDIYGSIISKKIDTTYAHTIKILAEMEDHNLIETRKEGRRKILTLTEKGKECADQFMELMDTLEVD